jgi:aryl-alcohol dehydrogenase-like predicted oxidoreductase
VVAQRGVASAARLRRTLDLYQVHQPHPVIGDGTTMAGMRTLQAAGVVDEVGVSNYSLARWQDAETALGARVISTQVEYSLVARGPERDLLPYAAETGRAVVAYSPLAQGLLSAKYDADHRPSNTVRSLRPLFLPENLRRAQPLLDVLREVADAHDATPSQVALAWTIHRSTVVAIPGASSVEQLESNVAAAEIRLSDGEYAALGAASDRFRPVGGLAALAGIARRQVGV